MGLKTKISIMVVAVILLTATAILASNIIQFSTSVDSDFSNRLETASSVAHSKIEMLKSEMGISARYIAADAAITEAMEAGDIPAVQSRAAQMFPETGASFCTVTDAAGIALARPHDPSSTGDSGMALPVVYNTLSGKNYVSIEPVASSRMSICAGSPIYSEQGELIGSVIVGFRLDTSDYVDYLKGLMGCEVTIFEGDMRVATTIIQGDGTRYTGTRADSDISRAVLSGQAFKGEVKVLGHTAMAKYTPIYDASGRIVGMIFAGLYEDSKNGLIFNFILMGLIITLLTFGIGMAVTSVVTSRIVKPLHVMSDFMRTASTTGEIEISSEELAQINEYAQLKDEIGQTIGSCAAFVERVRALSEFLEAVASGDLTHEVDRLSDSDTMGVALSHLFDNLNNMFGEINMSTTQVSTGAKQIADGAQSLAQGSTEQASSIEQLSSSIAEIAAKTKSNAGMAEKAATLAGTIKGNAERGNRQMDEMVAAVNEINDASGSINKVIKVIDDIAFQTNILALNAAVEAARAGAAGKGFAVVSDEVRSLAAKSAEAAKETGNLIANSIEKAQLGVQIAGDTAKSLSEIVAGINESSSLVWDIARSSEEQSAGIEQINTGIEQVALVVQHNSATAEESAASAEEMSSQSTLLQQLIAQFKLRGRQVPVAGIGGSASGMGASAMAAPTEARQKRIGSAPNARGAAYGKY
ncbi:MAG: methyl-accepting chemotaxis protein [Oscillospiraceae bacterium]|nr:methyl-accepting chemotaxis protein [Oscillospiraceae bacterium]